MTAALPGFEIGGLGDSAVGQSPGRIRAAAGAVGMPASQRRVTVNLSPAGVRKVGAGFDLAIFVAVAVAMGEVAQGVVGDVVHIGELGLGGAVRGVPGVLPAIHAAARAGVRHAVVPVDNAAEARLVAGIRVHPVAHVGELVQRYADLAKGRPVAEVPVPPVPPPGELPVRDLSEVVGQSEAKLALEIAAAGGHHLLMAGPAGGGQDDARRAAARGAAAARRGVLDGRDGDPLRARRPRRRRPADHPAALRRAAPRGVPGRRHRRGERPDPTGCDHPGPLRRALPRRDARVRQGRAPGAAHPARARARCRSPGPTRRSSSRPASSSCSRPTRARAATAGARASTARAARPAPGLLRQAVGARCSTGSTCRSTSSHRVCRWRRSLRGRDRPRWRRGLLPPDGASASGGASRWRSWASRGRLNSDVPGSLLRKGPERLPGSVTVTLDRALERGGISLRGYDRSLADRLDDRGPARASTARAASRSTSRCRCVTRRGWRHERRPVGAGGPVPPRRAV